MPTTIVGLFDSEQTAQNIRNELENRGLDYEHIDTVTWRSVSEGSDPWGIGGTSADYSPTARLAEELQSRGVPATDAQEFAEAVRRGGNLVITELGNDQNADEIARFMDQQESVDLGNRRQQWEQSGYSGFNPDADFYSSDEVERERSNLLGSSSAAGAGSTGGTGSTRGTKSKRTDGKSTRTDGEEARLQEAHEELRVGKRDVETGGIRVNKRVEEKPVEEDVHLHEEHANVERNKVDGSDVQARGDDGELFNEETIEVTEHAEEPVVDKTTHVDEEVRVGKEASEHTETVRDTVRESTIDIEELSGEVSDEYDFSRHDSDYRQHFSTNFGTDGKNYDDYESGYRYGHTFGSSDRYDGRDYNAAEPDIRRSYEDKHGKGTFDRVRDAARHAYDRVRGKRG